MYLISKVRDLAEWSRAERWSQQDLGRILALPWWTLSPSYLVCNLGRWEAKMRQASRKLLAPRLGYIGAG